MKHPKICIALVFGCLLQTNTVLQTDTVRLRAGQTILQATQPAATAEPELTPEATKPRSAKVPHSVPSALLAEFQLVKNQLVRLSKTDAVWVDKKTKWVLVAGSVCNRKGPLEMFACPRGTKDYESVVAVDSRAQVVHAALLAAGIKTGRPVAFVPEYKAATGPIIEITVVWTDPTTKKLVRARAQKWVRHAASNSEMSAEWVFAGSGFWKDPDTGEQHYLAEGGELVCVSNFSTATLDLPVPSPEGNEDLYFDAFTDNIPPVRTRVWLLMREKKQPANAPK